ncbi:arylamine N-acetyltransferase family protein [Priestia abyssalis]|uniref:arylamine N-acetyltransferase family protein n=1 Tax=Priestia abyssalis TaxID=1221450 RepID=UPI000994FEF9|nr:arylamine N-acetyltransferase [Priestia abyssalis]
MDKAAYLNRFAAEKEKEATLDYLYHLQEQHMLHIPFENLDVIYQTPILLDVQRFYQKIVEHRRGGFCYELNGLFCWLLEQLGFDAHLISATVQKENGSWALQDSHATLLVHLDKRTYLVDVGFGDSVRKPIPLTGETVEDVRSVYRVKQLDSMTYDLQKQEKSWKTKYRFTTDKKKLEQFAPMCEFNQTSPDSPFTKTNLTTIATKTGRITLSGTTLITTNDQGKQKMEVQSDEIPALLEKYFQINLTQ